MRKDLEDQSLDLEDLNLSNDFLGNNLKSILFKCFWISIDQINYEQIDYQSRQRNFARRRKEMEVHQGSL